MVRPGVMTAKFLTPWVARYSIEPARMYVLPTPVAESMTPSNGALFVSTSNHWLSSAARVSTARIFGSRRSNFAATDSKALVSTSVVTQGLPHCHSHPRPPQLGCAEYATSGSADN